MTLASGTVRTPARGLRGFLFSPQFGRPGAVRGAHRTRAGAGERQKGGMESESFCLLSLASVPCFELHGPHQ